MKTKIEAIENLMKNGGKWSDINVSPTFGRSYISSKEYDNELIDFDDLLRDYDIEEIVESCKTFGITEFTISGRCTNTIDALYKFTELGCKIDGVTKINDCVRDLRTGKFILCNAIKLSL